LETEKEVKVQAKVASSFKHEAILPTKCPYICFWR